MSVQLGKLHWIVVSWMESIGKPIENEIIFKKKVEVKKSAYWMPGKTKREQITMAAITQA